MKTTKITHKFYLEIYDPVLRKWYVKSTGDQNRLLPWSLRLRKRYPTWSIRVVERTIQEEILIQYRGKTNG